MDEFWRNAYITLQQWEKLKQYPPYLSLEIMRTQNACEHLRTDVTVKGVEPEVTIQISAPCSGYYYTAIYTSFIPLGIVCHDLFR